MIKLMMPTVDYCPRSHDVQVILSDNDFITFQNMEKVKNKFAKAVLDLETYGLQLKPTSEPRIIEQVLSYIAQASALSTYCDTRYSESTTIQNRFADVMNAVIARAGDNIADAITDAIWQTEELCELEGVRHK